MAEADFSPQMEAMVLRGALDADETPASLIIGVVGKRSLNQRLEIEKAYNKKYEDLKKDLEKKLTGNFQKLTVTLFYDKPERDARFLNQAMVGLGTDEDCLNEILVTRSNQEIHNIKEAYNKIYGHDLEDDIVGDTSFDYKNFLLHLLKESREDSAPVDRSLAEKEAKELYDAGEMKWGTDENKFVTIFTKRSFPQLVATFEQYEKISTRTMAEAVCSEFSLDIKNALLAVIEIARSESAYFAKRLYKMYECKSDDGLIRLVVTCESHMQSIKQDFLALYKKSLEDCIKEVTSGDYSKMLLEVVGRGK